MDEQEYLNMIEDQKTMARTFLAIKVWKFAGWAGLDYNLRTGEIRPLTNPEPIYRELRRKRTV